MSSEKRIAASRANGARSRGPKTPEGKAKSSRNAKRHGLLAKVIVLEEEPQEAFLKICNSYADLFGPLNEVEAGMVHEMIATYWRLRRAWAIENRYFDTAMAEQNGPSPTDRLMTAFSSLADANRLNLLHRYETRLHLMYQRAFRNLLQLRKVSSADVGQASRPAQDIERPQVGQASRPAQSPERLSKARLRPAHHPAPIPPIPNEPETPIPCNTVFPDEPETNLKSPVPEPVLDTNPGRA